MVVYKELNHDIRMMIVDDDTYTYNKECTY